MPLGLHILPCGFADGLIIPTFLRVLIGKVPQPMLRPEVHVLIVGDSSSWQASSWQGPGLPLAAGGVGVADRPVHRHLANTRAAWSFAAVLFAHPAREGSSARHDGDQDMGDEECRLVGEHRTTHLQ